MIQHMAEGFKHLHDGLVCNLQMAVAKAKAVAMASQEDIANALNKQLGDFGGRVKMHIRRLGVEHTHTFAETSPWCSEPGSSKQKPGMPEQSC